MLAAALAAGRLEAQAVAPTALDPMLEASYVLESINDAPLPYRTSRHRLELVVEGGRLVLERNGEYELALDGTARSRREVLVGDEGVVVPEGDSIGFWSGVHDGAVYRARFDAERGLCLVEVPLPGNGEERWVLRFRLARSGAGRTDSARPGP